MYLANLKIRTRFILLLALFIAGFAVYGAWSLKTLNDLKVNGLLYQRIVQSKDLVADILPPPEYILESYLVTLQIAGAADKAQQDALIDRLKSLKSDYDTRHDYWAKATLETPLNDALIHQAHEPALAFYTIAFNALVPAVQKGDKDATAAALAELEEVYDMHRKAIDKVVDMSNKRTDADEATAKSRIESSTMLLVAILIPVGQRQRRCRPDDHAQHPETAAASRERRQDRCFRRPDQPDRRADG